MLVWDLPTRVFHWCLVTATAAALLTGFFALPRRLDPHLAAGGIVGLLLVFRGLWSSLGPGPSRGSALFFPPARILARLRGVDRSRYLGHNPLAGLVLGGVLLALLGLVVSGTVVLGGEEQRGPLRAWLSWRVGHSSKLVHEGLAWAVVLGVVLHLGGMTHEGRALREPVARSMITGRRPAHPAAVRPPAARAHPVVAAALFVGLLVHGALGARRLTQYPVRGWRSLDGAPDHALFAKECGACHTLYHPSLLPAESWSRMMASLDEHFGEDASLGPGPAAAIATLLTQNANGGWDTEASNLLRPPPGTPATEAVTEVAWWKDSHAEALAGLRLHRPDATAADCESCHPDAVSGRFAGHLIHAQPLEPRP